WTAPVASHADPRRVCAVRGPSDCSDLRDASRAALECHRPALTAAGRTFGRSPHAAWQTRRLAGDGRHDGRGRRRLCAARRGLGLGPRMWELSGEFAAGARAYDRRPERRAEARRILRPGKLLCPEVWRLLETAASKAWDLGRQALAPYLRLDNYVNNWKRPGFG